MPSERLFLGCLVLLLAGGACTSPGDDPPTVDQTVVDSARAPEPIRVSPAEFQQLRWMEGRWRGEEPNGQSFFEGYRFENDSTIRSYTYADSANRVPTDSGAIALRGGEVTSGSEGARWVASELTASHIEFAPQVGVRNSFVWQRESDDAWTATLRWPGTADRPAREVVYRMRRLSP